MSEFAIRAVGLGKRYQIGQPIRPASLREALQNGLAGPWRRLRRLSGYCTDVETVWALRDVTLEIPAGKVVGIIGRNGSGKSSLLKIVSRIIRPSEGEVTLTGPVASLLEVGTGFHPELSGRENIFLNGCICGMNRAEIKRKLDSIVEYAEIGPFLDTPIKRYSSGMRVRLAFSIAAHLEPDILAIDEVLAVGDVGFQEKCLGHMDRIAGMGRTVLFVSHNLQAIQTHCELVYQLEGGRLVRVGDAASVVTSYLAENSHAAPERCWPENQAPGDKHVQLLSVRVAGEGHGGVFLTSADVVIEFELRITERAQSLVVGFDLLTVDGVVVLRSMNSDQSRQFAPRLRMGSNRLLCRIPGGLLNGGQYQLAVRIGCQVPHRIDWVVHLDSAVRFEMVLNHHDALAPDVQSGNGCCGVIAPLLTWSG